MLALPFVLCDVALLAERAFAMAESHQQRAYDCLYVAKEERDGVESCGLVTSACTMRCMSTILVSGGLQTISDVAQKRMRDRHNIHRHNVALPTTPPSPGPWLVK